MNSLYANTVNELEKIFIRRKPQLFLLFAFLLPFGFAFIFDTIKNTLGLFTVQNTHFSLLMLSFFTTFYLPLIIFMVVSDIFTGELENRTLQITLLRPITRLNVFSTKIIATMVFVIVQLCLVFVSSNLAGLIVDNSLNLAGFFDIAKAFTASVLPMLSIICLTSLVAVWFHSSTGTFIACVILYVLATALPFFYPGAGSFSLFSYTTWHTLWLGNSISFMHVFNIIVFLLSSSLIFFTLGYYKFERREL